MSPGQENAGLLHQLPVRRLETVVGVLAVEHAGYVVDGHAVHISLGGGVQLGMETVRNLIYPDDRNVHGKISVEVMLHIQKLHIGSRLEIGDLRIGMYANLGTASAVQFGIGFSGHLSDDF